jgi:hypothetical protein
MIRNPTNTFQLVFLARGVLFSLQDFSQSLSIVSLGNFSFQMHFCIHNTALTLPYGQRILELYSKNVDILLS